jgi:hypothetical protein
MSNPKQPPVFAYPRLSKTDLLFLRLGGNGLGNLMFAWARALSASQRYGWRMVWPTWGSLKPKNWRVNPYDHRTYFDLFKPNDRYVTGWRKPWCLARYPWVPETEALEHGAAPGSVVQFRGMEGMFAPFRDDHELVYGELLDLARPQHLRAFSDPDPAPIGIHVRRGDFVWYDTWEETISIHNSMLPTEWYVGAVQAVRSAIGRQTRAYLFSDGSEEELAPLLGLPNVERVHFGSGLADMLALTRCRLLITSGSTFSMWGSYLGQVPAIWHPGKRLMHLLLEHPEREIEWLPGDPLPAWVTDVL